MGSHVLLYWPNIVGYIRISLLFTAWVFYHTPTAFLLLYFSSVLLDGVDGWLARRLKQESKFGAWLDVVVDNLSRGMLWSLLSQCGWLVSAVEWCVFVCNHSSKGDDWKNSFSHSPKIVQAIMANGFRTPLGLLVVCGLHGLPLWFYCTLHGLLPLSLPLWAQGGLTVLLIVGRTLAFIAERAGAGAGAGAGARAQLSHAYPVTNVDMFGIHVSYVRRPRRLWNPNVLISFMEGVSGRKSQRYTHTHVQTLQK